MIADVLTATAVVEEVPAWVKYVGGLAGTLILAPAGAVLVQYLRRRLGVPDDTNSPTTAPTPNSPQSEDERELSELQAALADVLIDLRSARAQAAAAEQRAAMAEKRAERLQNVLERMAERMDHPPPPPLPPA